MQSERNAQHCASSAVSVSGSPRPQPRVHVPSHRRLTYIMYQYPINTNPYNIHSNIVPFAAIAVTLRELATIGAPACLNRKEVPTNPWDVPLPDKKPVSLW